jgi:hypothetical protein
MNTYYKFIFKCLIIIVIVCFNQLTTFCQVTISVSKYECGEDGGQIKIVSLTPSTFYDIGYTKDGTVITSKSFVADAAGIVTIKNLSAGNYYDFNYKKTADASTTAIAGAYIMNSCLAKQTTKFFAAGFTNFTGIQDDDPKNYTQVYAYISQPLNRSAGIQPDNMRARLIPFRNGYFQIVYGNTDNFKMYTFDTLNDKYVNKLDLMAHSYLNANLRLNLLTYIIPQNHKEGDMAHLYLDLMTSLLLTNVTDTLQKSDDATNKVYNIKSSLYGINLRSKFNKVFDSKFGIEAGVELYEIFSLSSTTNNLLNPQSSNIGDIKYAQNSAKDFITKKSPLYTKLDVLLSYNTAASDSKSESNVFLHYSFTGNYAKRDSKNYPNSYFQFQIGYALDITKIFSPKSGD